MAEIYDNDKPFNWDGMAFQEQYYKAFFLLQDCRITEQEQVALSLKIEGMHITKIAGILRVSPRTVNRLINRITHKLKAITYCLDNNKLKSQDFMEYYEKYIREDHEKVKEEYQNSKHQSLFESE